MGSLLQIQNIYLFAQFVLEQKKLADSINIALKKIQGQPITASQMKSDVNKLKGMVCQDQAYLFLRQHLHALIWTSDCLKLTSESTDAYVGFVDKHVQANLPSPKNEPELQHLVKTYQRHNHSKTCRKYKNIPCRFNFGQFFTRQTVVAEPLDENTNEETKSNILK